MRFLRVPLLLMLSCLPSKAREQAMDVGGGVVCDTAQQIERFVALRSVGKESAAALQAVNDNDEVRGSAACNFALVMFTGGEPIAEFSVNGKPVSIIEITVHAVGNGSAWKQVPAIAQYTAVVEKGILI